MVFQVTNVDTRTWCGRMHAPEPSDVGLLVRPMRMEAIYLGEDGNEGDGVLQSDGPVGENADWTVLDTHPVEDYTEERIARFWYCLTADGRVLQMHQSEIEWVEISERDFGGGEDFGRMLREVSETKQELEVAKTMFEEAFSGIVTRDHELGEKDAEIQRLIETVEKFEDREEESLRQIARLQTVIDLLKTELNDLSGKF